MERIFSITKKDFEIQTFRAGGPGGQNQNKRDTGVRIIHHQSGAVGESRTERSQAQNKKLALRRLVDSKKFKLWLNRVVWEITSGKTLEQRVGEAMDPQNLKVEVRKDRHWQVAEEMFEGVDQEIK